MIENRIEEAPPYGDTEAFDSKTRTVPDEIGGTEATQGAPVQAAIDPSIWTPEEVAEQFTAALAFAEMSLGPHWVVDEAGLLRLGAAWCPIFQRHVPKYGNAAPWVGTIMMWMGALGATKTVLGPPLKKEIELAKQRELQKRRRVSYPANTRTAPSVEASESSESEAPESQRSWSAS